MIILFLASIHMIALTMLSYYAGTDKIKYENHLDPAEIVSVLKNLLVVI